MIQFSRLRLNGFKSFVERAELEINPGLTGIVGPNGCGKSNLVEALRWSMGESSSKRMRGGSGSMEDVIFNGTANRPARNMAEVSILLDNSQKTAPAPYNEFEEIEVTRKIERDHGSGYRINGKNVRARDVQLLYADMMSGANSPYLVSQGKITNMIQARPAERRQILEEAAGITGLYARRHEAELRLRATDNNLKRLDDQAGVMDNRLQSLKRQARQANRYRNLSKQIRELEVQIAVLDWKKAGKKVKDIEQSYNEQDSQVAKHMTAVSQLTKTHNVQAQELPDLRKRDADLGAKLQKERLTLERLEDEHKALEGAFGDAKSQLQQIGVDRAHETQTLQENTSILENLEKEEKTILEGQGKDDERLEQSEARKEELKSEVNELDTRYTAHKEKLAADNARRQSLEQKIADDNERHEMLKERLDTLQADLQEKKALAKEQDETEELQKKIEKLEAESTKIRDAIEKFQEEENKLSEAKDNLRDRLQEEDAKRSKLLTEISALESFLETFSESDEYESIVDDVVTEKGFEIALSRAFGDTLSGSQDENASMQWQILSDEDDLPALPDGAEPLSPHIKAPKVLWKALSQIGVVDDQETGQKLAKQLKPGQSLVTRDGAYWRWDGLHIQVEAADRFAEQLKHKNHLQDLKSQTSNADKAVDKAQKDLEKSDAALVKTKEELAANRDKAREIEAEIRETRQKRDEQISKFSELKAELAKLEEALSHAQSDLKMLEEQIKENETTLEVFESDSNDTDDVDIEALREKLSAKRETLQDHIGQLEREKQEQNRRQARVRAIADERVNLQNRCIRGKERLKELDEREKSLTAKLASLEDRPDKIKAEKDDYLTRIVETEKEKRLVADKLAVNEAELTETTKSLKEAEARLAEARESRAHSQATWEERQANLRRIEAAIQEKYNCTPTQLLSQAPIDTDEENQSLEKLKEEREKAIRSRDMIGPVNLRAEQEAEELEKEFGTILSERNDLMEAVNELRNGINKLNKEARERLQAAFEIVNAHFREMFTRLYNGGKAHLALIDSDDPLEAGLEIFAQPPGKALQSLSLLSGGEQTLTALALLFAMFLTNKSPICVLDEVDAPLDDANVDRVCDMLEEFAERGETRFLIITHHRLTMARMDRLYGVTMSERGVSQLVSVDLNQQLDFLEAAE